MLLLTPCASTWRLRERPEGVTRTMFGIEKQTRSFCAVFSVGQDLSLVCMSKAFDLEVHS